MHNEQEWTHQIQPQAEDGGYGTQPALGIHRIPLVLSWFLSSASVLLNFFLASVTRQHRSCCCMHACLACFKFANARGEACKERGLGIDTPQDTTNGLVLSRQHGRF